MAQALQPEDAQNAEVMKRQEKRLDDGETSSVIEPLQSGSLSRSTSDFLKGLFQRGFELEMLVSGIAILTLLRAPDGLDAIEQWALLNAKGGDFFSIAFGIVRAVRAAVYIVTFNFILHLFLRCFWVSLIGLRSTQNDAELERLLSKYPPALRAFWQERGLSLEALAERVDRICRMIFALTFTAVAVTLYAAMGMLIGIYAASAKKEQIIAAILCISALWLLLYALDSTAKKVPAVARFMQAPALFGAMKKLYGLYETLGLNVIFRPMFNALAANIGKGALYGVLFVYGVAWLFLWLGVKIDNFDFFPERWRGAYMMQPAYYENLRIEGKLTLAPFIQSDILREPFLKLVIPYDVSYNDSLLASAPALAEMNRSDPTAAQVELAIKTMQSFYQIALNDSTLTGVEFAFYKLPKTNQPSIIAYIPVDHLPKGKNTLRIKAGKEEWVIPFYR